MTPKGVELSYFGGANDKASPEVEGAFASSKPEHSRVNVRNKMVGFASGCVRHLRSRNSTPNLPKKNQPRPSNRLRLICLVGWIGVRRSGPARIFVSADSPFVSEDGGLCTEGKISGPVTVTDCGNAAGTVRGRDPKHARNSLLVRTAMRYRLSPVIAGRNYVSARDSLIHSSVGGFLKVRKPGSETGKPTPFEQTRGLRPTSETQ